MKQKIVILVLVFALGLIIKYPEMQLVSIKILTIWIVCASLIGVFIPFFVYSSSFTNKTIYSNENDSDDKRIIKPKKTALFIGAVMVVFGTGLLIRNSFDLATSGIIFIGLFSMVGYYLYPTRKNAL